MEHTDNIEELVNRVNSLEWTWLDEDRDVAWRTSPEESAYGGLREILLEAGWKACYHNDGAIFHYDIKLNGMGSWRAFQEAFKGFNGDRSEVNEIAQNIQDSELEFGFWEHSLGEFFDENNIDKETRSRVFSCGRSGGYLNAERLERLHHAETMIRLGFFLEDQRAYYNSEEWGTYLAEMALEEYQARRMEALASPRIERIEA